VKVDKARPDQFAAGIDLFGALAGNAADFRNATVRYRDIRFEQFATETVGDAAVADDEIWIAGHAFHPEVICCRIMDCRALLSTAAGEVQGCISLASGASELRSEERR